MDGEITHFLDGIQVGEPKGVQDFTEEIDRNIKERILAVKYASPLTFTHDGYTYLNDKFIADGYCGEVAYEAYHECDGDTRLCARGVIKISDVKFDLSKCEADAPVTSDGAGANLANNNEIPISPLAPKSKNGVAITPVTTFSLEVFDPDDVIPPANRNAWDWWEAMQHAVQYMSDGQQTIVSDWYDALPDTERYAITTGEELRTGAGNEERVVWNFKRLFFEIAMKYDLWIGIQRVNDLPVIRVEPQSYWYGTSPTLYHTDLEGLVRAVDIDKLWASVEVGSDIGEREYGATFALPFIVLRGHTKEEFHFAGVCNTKEKLDLVNEWIIDTNVIQDIFVNGNDEHDDELVIIQYDRSTNDAVQGDYLNPSNLPFLYNEQLLNINVLARYALPSPVGAYFNSLAAEAQAVRTVTASTEFYSGPAGSSALAIVQFDTDFPPDGYDTTNAWGNGTAQGTPVSQANSRYTAAGQGSFNFEFDVRWRVVGSEPTLIGGPIPITLFKRISLSIAFERYDSGNTLISTQTFTTTPTYALGVFSLNEEVSVSMNTGDYVQVRYNFIHTDFAPAPTQNGTGGAPGITVQLLDDSVFRTLFIYGGGYVNGTGEAPRVITYEFERPIGTAAWVSLTADPRAMVNIGGGPNALTQTHVLNAKRKVFDGSTEWTMIAKP